MKYMIILVMVTVPVFFAGFAYTVQAEDTGSGEMRIVNVVDDFINYYKKCRNADGKTRIAGWDRLLESKHENFFNDAIYRKKTGEDREQYKAHCIERFWEEIAPKMREINELNKGIVQEINTVLADFQKVFPDYEPVTDFYITISFSFRGKVVDVAGKDIFAIGMEYFGDDKAQLQITIAHELFHLHHFGYFSPSGGLYRILWAEGMATYASAVVVPGYRDSRYLGFSGEKMNKCAELLPGMAKELRENMDDSDQKLKRIYFGAEDNDTEIPPEAGYYVGLLIVGEVAKKTPVDKLAKLKADEVYRIVKSELIRLENQKQ